MTHISLADIMVADITADDIVKEGRIQVSGYQEWSALTEAVYYILLSLYTPLHGYGIMQKAKELSNERVNLGPGTLYGAINTLLEKKWIKSVDGEKDSRKKEYEITSMGKKVVNMEIIRLEELISNGKKIIGGEF